ncbi:ataxin-7-like [Tubulanus polymorphus]|uniref:ataxin-7-like n=1 Tax=Tubulanus polymorphus TaxID=672921 RepID=UPI003DA6950F
MATEDDSPSLFAGQAWTVWASAATVDNKNEDNNEDKGSTVKRGSRSDSMKLRKADMGLYGLCPSQDEFYLVMCDKCGHVVKPQALQHHIVAEKQEINVVNALDAERGRHRCTAHTFDSEYSRSLYITDQSHGNRKKQSSVSSSPVSVKSLPVTPNKTPSKSSSSRSTHTPSPSIKRPLTPPLVTTKTSVDNESDDDLIANKEQELRGKERLKEPLEKSCKNTTKDVIDTKQSNREGVQEARIKRNHSMPVVKVERMPSPLAMKKSVTLHPEKGPPPETSRKTVPSPVSNVTHGVDPPPSHHPLQTAPSVSRTISTVAAASSATSVVMTSASVTSVQTSNKSTVPAPLFFKKEKLLPCKDREFDPNKHCGVWIPDIAKQCTRSLTCKTHALSLRRAVKGRRKTFDQLLDEHRATKELLTQAKAAAAAAANKSAPASSGAKILPANRKSDSKSAKSGQINGVNAVTAISKPILTLASSLSCTSSIAAVTKLAKTPKLINSVVQRPAFSPPLRPYLPQDSSPASEFTSRLSSDGEDDEYHDKMDCSYVTHHPRPAATCTFGARWNGHFVFNRKQDLLKAAFSQAVEKHLHPPPYTKLCLESKLPQELSSDSKDPYDFNYADPASQIAANLAQLNATKNVNRVPKPKTITKAVKRESTSGLQPGKQSQPAKRHRSGSSPSVTVNNTNTPLISNPISISIPSGVNVSLGSVGSMNTLEKSNSNNFIKDISLVVTSMNEGGLANGQLINITSANVADSTHSLNSNTLKSSAAVAAGTNPKIKTTLKAKPQIQDIRANNFFATIPAGTLLMESTTQPGTLIAASSALGTLAGNHVTSTTPSPFRSSSIAANGILCPTSRNSSPSPSKPADILPSQKLSNKSASNRHQRTSGFQQVFAASIGSNAYIQPKINRASKQQTMQMTLPIVAQSNLLVSPQQQQLLLQADEQMAAQSNVIS